MQGDLMRKLSYGLGPLGLVIKLANLDKVRSCQVIHDLRKDQAVGHDHHDPGVSEGMHSEVGQVGEQRQPLFAEWRMGDYGVHGGQRPGPAAGGR